MAVVKVEVDNQRRAAQREKDKKEMDKLVVAKAPAVVAEVK
jgi:hypothetical protein